MHPRSRAAPTHPRTKNPPFHACNQRKGEQGQQRLLRSPSPHSLCAAETHGRAPHPCRDRRERLASAHPRAASAPPFGTSRTQSRLAPRSRGRSCTARGAGAHEERPTSPQQPSGVRSPLRLRGQGRTQARTTAAADAGTRAKATPTAAAKTESLREPPTLIFAHVHNSATGPLGRRRSQSTRGAHAQPHRWRGRPRQRRRSDVGSRRQCRAPQKRAHQHRTRVPCAVFRRELQRRGLRRASRPARRSGTRRCSSAPGERRWRPRVRALASRPRRSVRCASPLSAQRSPRT
mmetsp:Transcript_17085/g.55872  ORF Transcript_17085/g.55872 Transcript_17085/m.55872 type:complete len:291 (-) Transcript_17085:576-1448(-)